MSSEHRFSINDACVCLCRRYSPHPHPLLPDAVSTRKGCVCWTAALGSKPALACWRDAGRGRGAMVGSGLEMSWAAVTTVAGFGALPARYCYRVPNLAASAPSREYSVSSKMARGNC